MEYAIKLESVSKKIGVFSIRNITLKQDSGIVECIPKENIGVVIGEHTYYENLTCIEMAKILSHFYKDWNWEEFDMFMEELNLPMKRKIENLSKGMKVKFSLVCALSHKAKILILDEPTAGLDPSARYALLDELNKMAKKYTMAILFTSHISSDIELIADKIVYIKEGELVDFIDVSIIGEKYVVLRIDNYNDVCRLQSKTIFSKKGECWISVVKKEQLEKYKDIPYVKLEKASLDDIICFMNED